MPELTPASLTRWAAALARSLLLLGWTATLAQASAQPGPLDAIGLRLSEPDGEGAVLANDGATVDLTTDGDPVRVEVTGGPSTVRSYVFEIDGVRVATIDMPTSESLDVAVSAGDDDAEQF